MKVLTGDRGDSVKLVRRGDLAEPLAQVLKVAGNGENCHHFRSGGDVKAGFARVAVGAATEPNCYVAQGAVIHVERALPSNAERVDAVRVAVQDRGVEKGGEKVVGGTDGVNVTGEVEVQVLHRHDLRVAATGGATLDAEHRP